MYFCRVPLNAIWQIVVEAGTGTSATCLRLRFLLRLRLVASEVEAEQGGVWVGSQPLRQHCASVRVEGVVGQVKMGQCLVGR